MPHPASVHTPKQLSNAMPTSTHLSDADVRRHQQQRVRVHRRAALHVCTVITGDRQRSSPVSHTSAETEESTHDSSAGRRQMKRQHV